MVCAVLVPVLPQFQTLLRHAQAFAPRLAALAFQSGLAVTRADSTAQPIPVGATPVLLAAEEIRRRHHLAERLASAGFKMAQAVVQNPDRGWLLDALGPIERRILEKAAPGLQGLAIARVDFFAAKKLSALELNATIPAMAGYSDMAAEAFIDAAGELGGLDHAARAELKLRNGSNTTALYQALLGAFTSVRSGAHPKRIALLCRRADAQLTEVHYLAQRFRALGTEAEVVHPDEFSGTSTVQAHGRQFDLVYRHLFIRRLDEAPNPWLEALFAAPDRRGCVLLNGPAAHIETKTNFVLLSRALVEPELAARAHLTDAELEAVRQTVPWTRRLLPGPGQDKDGGSVLDLVAHVAAEPARFVLKRAWDYGGKAVFIGSHASEPGFFQRAQAAFGQRLDWPAVVRAAAVDTRGGGFVVQERVEAPQARYWVASSVAEAVELELYVDYSAFCSVGLQAPPAWGGVVRGSASPVVNILGGGGVLPLLTAEVAAELDLALAAPRSPTR